jgi:ribulose kinase
MACYIGVDVGTASVRAVLVDANGSILASSTHPITVFRDPSDNRVFEQSSENIWSAICTTIRSTIWESQVAPESVKGLGFDATCSLAVCDADGKPVLVTHSDQLGQYGDRNIILWADHRAENEAHLINSTGSVVLDYVGGSMSVRPLHLFHVSPPNRI